MVRIALTLTFMILVSETSDAAPKVIESRAALQKLDFSKDRVVLIGETDHYDETLLSTEVKILEAIDSSNAANRKCLILEADSQFDEAFKILSKSTSPDALKKANQILDGYGLMPDAISWIGETFPLQQFRFAVARGWTVRSGDMLLSSEVRERVRNEPANDDFRSYHVIYQRNQFLANRIIELLNSDCDLAVVIFGAAHFYSVGNLATYKVKVTPVPALLEQRSIRSKTIFAANPKSLSLNEWMKPMSTKLIRSPEIVVAFP